MVGLQWLVKCYDHGVNAILADEMVRAMQTGNPVMQLVNNHLPSFAHNLLVEAVVRVVACTWRRAWARRCRCR